MKKLYMVFTTILILFFFSLLHGEEQKRIAVMDFKGLGVSNETAAAVSEIIRTELVSVKKYQVIDRTMLDKIIAEQKLNLTGMMDEKMTVKLGKMAGANYMLVGSLIKIGRTYTINARLISVETGIAEDSQVVRGDNEDALSMMCKDLVERIRRQGLDKSGEEKSATYTRWDGLVAEYLLASDLNDTSGNGFNGSGHGAGFSDNGVLCDLQNKGYFTIPRAVINNILPRGTITLWFKAEWGSEDKGCHILFDTADRNYGWDRFGMGVWKGFVNAYFFNGSYIGGDATENYFSSFHVHFQPGEWHCWTMTWDKDGIGGTPDKFRFYFDGRLLKSTTVAPNQNAVFEIPYVGRHVWDTVRADGVMKKLRFYNRPLPDGEILLLYADK